MLTFIAQALCAAQAIGLQQDWPTKLSAGRWVCECRVEKLRRGLAMHQLSMYLLLENAWIQKVSVSLESQNWRFPKSWGTPQIIIQVIRPWWLGDLFGDPPRGCSRRVRRSKNYLDSSKVIWTIYGKYIHNS